jgi:hypothetical protein
LDFLGEACLILLHCRCQQLVASLQQELTIEADLKLQAEAMATNLTTEVASR